MEAAFEVISKDEPDDDLAAIAAALGRANFLAGNTTRRAAHRAGTRDLRIAPPAGVRLAGIEHEGDDPLAPAERK